MTIFSFQKTAPVPVPPEDSWLAQPLEAVADEVEWHEVEGFGGQPIYVAKFKDGFWAIVTSYSNLIVVRKADSYRTFGYGEVKLHFEMKTIAYLDVSTRKRVALSWLRVLAAETK